ncbi:MAG: CDP-glucose 4,6-dehydratase [Aestuariibacter sp.]
MEKLVMIDLFNGVFHGRRVLITGNSGFKGTWLGYWLQLLGADVYGFSLDIPTTPGMYEIPSLKLQDEKQVWGNVVDESLLHQTFESIQPELVFHLAAQPIVRSSIENPVATYETNILGTAKLLSTILSKNSTIPFVVITSDKCYQNHEWVYGYREIDQLGGRDPYSASKACAELVFSSMCASFPQLNGATARAGNVIGGGDWAPDRIIPDAVSHWTNELSLKVRNPLATRPWQHVLEPLSGYLFLAKSLIESPGYVQSQAFNFGPTLDSDVSVESLLSSLAGHWSYSDTSVDYCEEPSIEATLLKLNCDKAKKVLGWEQRLSVDDAIKMTAEWYQAYYRKEDVASLTEEQIYFYSKMWSNNGNKLDRRS